MILFRKLSLHVKPEAPDPKLCFLQGGDVTEGAAGADVAHSAQCAGLKVS